MLGYDPLAPGNLHLYKHTFGSTSPDWSLAMTWPSGTWSTYYSESQLVSSSIYTFFPYGSTKYLYMVVISLSNGSVSTRYKSSVDCSLVNGSTASGDYVVATVLCTTHYYILMFNTVTNTFTIESFSGTYLYGVGLESTTNK